MIASIGNADGSTDTEREHGVPPAATPVSTKGYAGEFHDRVIPAAAG
jgi:hypothetical protein